MSADLVYVFIFVDLNLGFEDFILHFDVVNVSWFNYFIIFELKNELIQLGPLLGLEIELIISFNRVLRIDEHGHLFDFVFQVGSLLLKQVVVLLQNPH